MNRHPSPRTLSDVSCRPAPDQRDQPLGKWRGGMRPVACHARALTPGKGSPRLSRFQRQKQSPAGSLAKAKAAGRSRAPFTGLFAQRLRPAVDGGAAARGDVRCNPVHGVSRGGA